MPDKCTANLPVLRISDRLEQALMRLAAADDRALSDYVRRVLEVHAFGHVARMDDNAQGCQQCNASHCDARKARP